MKTIQQLGVAGVIALTGWLSAVTAQATIIITPASGYNITYVSEGGTMGPGNIALASNGSTPFAASEYGNPHFTSNLNDGLYGNNESWLRNINASYEGTENGNPLIFVMETWAGIDLPLTDGTTYNLTQVAWGRANDGGQTDRWAGKYQLQFTTDAIVNYGNAGNWTTIGIIELQSPSSGGYSEWLRHVYNISTSANQPIAATGFRFQIDNANNGDQIIIDELELYATAAVPEPSTILLLAMGGTLFYRKLRRS